MLDAAERGALDDLLARHGAGLLVLYGSAAEGVDDPRDIDVAVHPDREGFDPATFVTELSELIGFERIDVIDLSRAGSVARSEALGFGMPLFESEPGRFAETQMVAWAQRMDTRWLRDLELAYLAGR